MHPPPGKHMGFYTISIWYLTFPSPNQLQSTTPFTTPFRCEITPICDKLRYIWLFWQKSAIPWKHWILRHFRKSGNQASINSINSCLYASMLQSSLFCQRQNATVLAGAADLASCIYGLFAVFSFPKNVLLHHLHVSYKPCQTIWHHSM